MLKVDCIQLCQGPDVIAELRNDHDGSERWFIPQVSDRPGGIYEVVENEKELAQLYHCIGGDFTGYMVFRAAEYEDVQIVVVRL